MADFLRKVIGSLDKGFKIISSKSKEFLETTKLKGEIKNVEETIQKKFQALGKKVFEMVNKKAFSEEALKIDCGEITVLYKKITELEEAIKKVELEASKMRHRSDTIMCAKCGMPNKFGDKFCMSCGSAIIIEDKPEGKVCPACGASVKEGSKFCFRCGARLIP